MTGIQTSIKDVSKRLRQVLRTFRQSLNGLRVNRMGQSRAQPPFLTELSLAKSDGSAQHVRRTTMPSDSDDDSKESVPCPRTQTTTKRDCILSKTTDYVEPSSPPLYDESPIAKAARLDNRGKSLFLVESTFTPPPESLEIVDLTPETRHLLPNAQDQDHDDNSRPIECEDFEPVGIECDIVVNTDGSTRIRGMSVLSGQSKFSDIYFIRENGNRAIFSAVRMHPDGTQERIILKLLLLKLPARVEETRNCFLAFRPKSQASEIIRRTETWEAEAYKEVNTQLSLNLQPHGHVLRSSRILVDTVENVGILIEYPRFDGSLDSLISLPRLLSISELSSIATQMIQGLRHVHDCGFVHLDISLDNFLFSYSHEGGDPLVVLADFGLTESQNAAAKWGLGADPRPLSGKWDYVAPEMARRAGRVDAEGVDTWSLGASLFFMASGEVGWSDRFPASLGETEDSSMPAFAEYMHSLTQVDEFIFWWLSTRRHNDDPKPSVTWSI